MFIEKGDNGTERSFVSDCVGLTPSRLLLWELHSVLPPGLPL